MRYRFSFCFSLLISIFRVVVLPAQNNPTGYNYSYLTINEGLCDNFIRAIHKDQLGFVWIGTSNGLDRYDGYELKHYSASAKQPNRFIESNYIYDITEDASLHLWVASDAGLTRIDLQHEDISSLKEYKGAHHEILATPVQSILVDESQNLWIGKSDGLAYIVLNKERDIEEIRILKKDVDIRKIIRHSNEIWAGGKDQLLRYGSTNPLPGMPPWRTITMGNSLKSIMETTILFDLVEPLYEPSQEYRYGRGTWSWIVWQDQGILSDANDHGLMIIFHGSTHNSN